MGKRLALWLALVIITVAFSSCGDGVDSLDMPKSTDLEFWVTQDVADVDFSEHEEIFGWFGAREYLGKGYKAVTNVDENPSYPVQYVSYIVTAYPDYADGGQFVTQITVKDPTVMVFGLTVNSSPEEIDSAMSEAGYDVVEKGSGVTGFVSDEGVAVTFDLVAKTITVGVSVSNREGIIF